MSDEKVFRKNPEIVTRVIDKETILVPIYKTSDEINCIYNLNKPASRVWELIDGKTALHVIKDRLSEEFDATSKEINREMNTLLKDLKEIKAIIEAE